LIKALQQQHFGKFVLVLLSAATSSMLFMFLGTPVLRVLRNVYGSKVFWVSGAAICGGLILAFPEAMLFSLLLLSFWINIGLYQEFEERGNGGFWTAALSMTLGSLILIFGSLAWAQSMGVNLMEIMTNSWQEMIKRSGASAASLTTEYLSTVLLSTVILIQMSSLAFALMLDRKAALLFGLRYEKIASQMRVHEFRVPDFFIWITMISFLGTIPGLIQSSEPIFPVAMTVFMTMMGLYFFQGLAILEVSFLVFRVGSLMRFLIYFIVVGQLFFLLSAVGFIDYWVNFRQRMRNWKLSAGSPKNGENV
jgi:hypothetical protein